MFTVMKMDIIEKFQELMIKNNIDAYIIPTSDYHSSEYVSDFFKGRAYLSGFTGSAGTLLILRKTAYLWTDGRYYIQAAKQIEGRPITLMKQGQPNVPTIAEFLNTNLKDKNVLAFDGRVVSTSFALELKSKITANIEIITNIDLVNNVWSDRPKLPFSVIYKLDAFFSGKEYRDKIKEVRTALKRSNADAFVLSALEDQAWLYNLRAGDVSHTPVFLAFSVITPEHNYLFVDPNKIDLTIEKYLDENDIIVKPYFEVYEFIRNLKGRKILMDFNKVNYQLYSLAVPNNTLMNQQDPTLLMKAVKNETEIKNIKLAHIKDGAAFTKFMYYVKTNYAKKIEMSEISVSDYLARLRSKSEGFVDLSFSTICGFKDHAAMMHYSATPESNYTLDDHGFLLIDSGGHYLEGTTDITRTLALGRITDTMKVHFTTVLKSVIALSTAVFLKGCRGVNLDILCRGPIWKLMIDYKCGTGHGVGYLLSVHEAPNGFRWQIVPERNDSAVFEPGMITTNEPGIYLENKYGIRTENEMLCVEKGKNEFGEFLGFETITYAPIDLDAIKPSLLTREEKEWLNTYHQNVFDTVSPYLTAEEQEWLKHYTRKI